MNRFKIEIDDLTELQKYALLLLASRNYEPISGKLWFQKELFLLSRNITELEEDSDFDSDFMGPYSDIVDEELEQLELMGFMEKIGNKFKLTDSGKELLKSIEGEVRKDEQEMIGEFKELLNNLSSDELLALVYFAFPEMTEESVKIDRIKANRKNIAINLYRKSKVSVGKAAEIAGISLEDFLTELKNIGVSVYSP